MTLHIWVELRDAIDQHRNGEYDKENEVEHGHHIAIVYMMLEPKSRGKSVDIARPHAGHGAKDPPIYDEYGVLFQHNHIYKVDIIKLVIILTR